MIRRPTLFAVLTAVAALLLCAPGCRSFDTNPNEPPDQPVKESPISDELGGTGGSGSINTNDASGSDESQNRGEDLPKEKQAGDFDPSAVTH